MKYVVVVVDVVADAAYLNALILNVSESSFV